MEFKISEKSKKNWEKLMNELGIESQMTEEALIAKKIKEKGLCFLYEVQTFFHGEISCLCIFDPIVIQEHRKHFVRVLI